MEYNCKSCKKEYSSYQSLWIHNKKYHSVLIPHNSSITKTHKCKNCAKILSRIDNLHRHEKKCNKKTEELQQTHIQKLETKIEQLEKNINNDNIHKPETINNQLINIIMNKNKAIEELKNLQDITPNNYEKNEEIKNNIIESQTLTLNNVIIKSRTEDNYINATQLCQAGNKLFDNWYSLETTNELINELASEAEIPVSQLIDTNFQQGSWIHPDLAIQLAQWISPKFALQVSKWIRSLFSNDKVEINMQQSCKLLKEQEKEIKLKDQKIQLLQDQFQKKQQRKDYPQKNVIYILTTEDNKKKRNYIVGKAKILKDRLSGYNKTAEHEVIYYKECKNEEQMKITESMVLNKLKLYREKANRDRFILPIENDIKLFTNVIDKSIEFFN